MKVQAQRVTEMSVNFCQDTRLRSPGESKLLGPYFAVFETSSLNRL